MSLDSSKAEILLSRLRKKTTHFSWNTQVKQDCQMKTSPQTFSYRHQTQIQLNFNRIKERSLFQHTEVATAFFMEQNSFT